LVVAKKKRREKSASLMKARNNNTALPGKGAANARPIGSGRFTAMQAVWLTGTVESTGFVLFLKCLVEVKRVVSQKRILLLDSKSI
jgi:hypothetical protein